MAQPNALTKEQIKTPSIVSPIKNPKIHIGINVQIRIAIKVIAQSSKILIFLIFSFLVQVAI